MSQQLKLYLLVLVFSVFASNAAAQFGIVRSISPSQVQAGATAFPLVVKGSRFYKGSQVQVNGVTLDTIAIEWDKLRATVPASLVAAPGDLQVKVIWKGRESSALSLNVSDAPVGNYNWSLLAAKLQGFVPNTVGGYSFMISRHGQIIYRNSFGTYRDNSGVTQNYNENTVIDIASSTKMPSNMAILTLADEIDPQTGRPRLDLDAPIGQYLQGYLTVPSDKATITTRMLLNHTSGLGQPGDPNAPPGQRGGCLNQAYGITLQACAQQVLNTPLVYQDLPPGSEFAYSGGGPQVAGAIVEAITGGSYLAYFNQKIRDKIGLTRFNYGAGNVTNPRIAGGALSDVGDYTKIMQTYLAGGVYGDTRVISQDQYALMQINQKGALPVVNSPGGTTLTGYSFGWWQSDPAYLQSQPQPQTPGLELSDQGAFGCTPWIDLEYNYTAILLIQDRTTTGTTIWNQIRPLIIEQMQNNP